MAEEVYRIDSTAPNAGEQIDATLAEFRRKCHDGRAWGIDITKEKDGGQSVILHFGPPPATQADDALDWGPAAQS